MPIYGYRCSECGHELEVFQSMSAEPLRECPECSGSLRKLLYPVGVHFKGSGFYSTDYKNGGDAKSKTGAGEAPKSESGSDAAKPAATGESTASSSTEKKPAAATKE